MAFQGFSARFQPGSDERQMNRGFGQRSVRSGYRPHRDEAMHR
jgi:hypothetical protein